ncbi:RNA methyltransferase [Bdellovibrio sp. KM01]|uniref:TrmH family RNA methyltransferase n=1 Tax=Bdellovibrio sp. KM01 TaxID=2748865 RepID=UPI0015EA5421|nr:RNA methyltransferase [Bdellovibrio sp. KM01]QLY26181.1 RNA methyltransferase [Bdellovibrio sp. KM01]
MKKNNFRSGSKNNSQRSSQGSSRPPGSRPQQSGGRSQGGRPQQGSRSENSIPREWRIVVGNHAIKEALYMRPKKVKGMWLKNGWESSADLRDLEEMARKHHITPEIRQEAVIDKFGSSHQGAALFVEGAPGMDLDHLGNLETSIVLMLDGIEDPHNLGAILRTSWLTNVKGVLIPEDRAVGLTPTVHKVACGGVEHVAVESTTNFSKYAETLKEKGYWIYGLSPRGKKSIFELDLPEKVIWAIGAEDKGLRVTTERLCDELVFIPQTSASASYNASVATAMALTETLRQHAQRGKSKKSQSDR